MKYPICDDNVELYHTTETENLESIFKEGLLIEKSDIENLVELNYEFMNYEDPDYTLEDARLVIGEGFIFASKEPDQYDIMSSSNKPHTILGIKKGKDCSYKFEEEEINAVEEWVSRENIPKKCLCIFEK